MTNLNSRILIVDDEPMLRRTMSDRMKFWGCTTEEAATGEEALEMLGRKSYDLVLLDIKMPGISGIDLLHHIRSLEQDPAVILLTGYGSKSEGLEGMRLGAFDCLMKPIDINTLIEKINEAVDVNESPGKP